MRRFAILFLLLICTLGNTTLAETNTGNPANENSALSFTAYPGFYIVGEDFPAGIYEIECAQGTSLINLVIKDADGKKVTSGGFWADQNEKLGKIDLQTGFLVEVSDGSAYFSPSSGGIIFDNVSPTESKAKIEYDELVTRAIEELKSHWKAKYAENSESLGEGGYLEIKNTRIIWIQDEPKSAQDKADNATNYAEKSFGNIDCVIEFVLFSDFAGSAPYYFNVGMDDHVMFSSDGTVTVGRNPFVVYSSRIYSYDFSGIINRIEDLGTSYNAVYWLLEE